MNKLKVVAYCRVSTNHEEQESSLKVQVSYYKKLITERSDWKLVKIYAERASGTQLKKYRVYEDDQDLSTRKD